MRARWVRLGAVVAVVATAFVASLATGGAGAAVKAKYPRGQTLFTTGTQWGPYSDLNPFKNWDYVTGTVGLAYETMFRYDPLKAKFIPWLASNGKWANKSTYVATVRSGVTWNDGKPLTAADVAFTFNTLKIPEHPQHTLWTSGLKAVKTSGSTVHFTFSGTPNYQEWDNYLYNVPIVPQHVWKSYSNKDIVGGNLSN